jgi:hypothetical protein
MAKPVPTQAQVRAHIVAELLAEAAEADRIAVQAGVVSAISPGLRDAARLVERNGRGVHKPFSDDGVLYCGWDGHDGCGEVWPCSTVRLSGRSAEIALCADEVA